MSVDKIAALACEYISEVEIDETCTHSGKRIPEKRYVLGHVFLNKPLFALITFTNVNSIETSSDSKFSFGPYSVYLVTVPQFSYTFVSYFLNNV